MKPGDVVELKQGTFGLAGQDVVAIYLDRVKRKKNYLAVVHTKGGTKEVSTDAVRRVLLMARVGDPAQLDPGELDARLAQLKSELAANNMGPGSGGAAASATGRGGASGGKGKKKDKGGGKVPEELSDRRLWELAVNEITEDDDGEMGTLTPEQAAEIVFEGDYDRDDLANVRNALTSCQTKGVGYFERASGRGERWRPWSVDQVKAIRREIEGMHALRNRLLKVTEIVNEETGEVDKLVEGRPRDEAELDEDDERRLELLGRYMASFVLHDEDRGEVGLADTSCHTLDGFTLFRFAKFLVLDHQVATSSSISGAFLRFMIDMRLVTVREANELASRRHVLASQFFDWAYPERCLKEAERFPGTVPEAWYEGRRDLTHLESYTIDPPDAKDFDDAVCVEGADDGSGDTLLYVSIADVAQYVTQGSLIDHEAKQRGTSVYLPMGVLPMLPHRLADDLCSLRADDVRPAMTAILRVAEDGTVKDAEVCESIIQVRENLAYDTVNDAIAEGREPFASLHALAQRLASQRGGLTLETDELKVHIDHDAVDPHLKSGSDATRMIEQFMVAANEAVARVLTEAGLAAPYRCHPLPARASAAQFNKRMEIMELPYRLELPDPHEGEDGAGEATEEEGEDFLAALKGGKVELMGGGGFAQVQDEPDDEDGDDASEGDGDDGDGATGVSGAPILKGLAQLEPEEREAYLEPFRAVLDRLDELDDDQLADLVQFKLLSCMGRALYTPENLGHFGLGSTHYLHFTSPIRRYPDLVTHRQLKWLLRGGPDGNAEAGAEDPPYSPQDLAELCPMNTDQSVEAERLERTLIGVALAFEARTDRWAGVHRAMVNGMTQGGVFLSFKSGVEARLSTSDIPGGPWSVDDADAMLFKGSLDDPTVGTEDAGDKGWGNWRELYDPSSEEMVWVRLRLGDKLNVRITDYDLVEGRIRCRLASEDAGE